MDGFKRARKKNCLVCVCCFFFFSHLYWNFAVFACGRQTPRDSPCKQSSSSRPGYPTECREYSGDVGTCSALSAHTDRPAGAPGSWSADDLNFGVFPRSHARISNRLGVSWSIGRTTLKSGFLVICLTKSVCVCVTHRHLIGVNSVFHPVFFNVRDPLSSPSDSQRVTLHSTSTRTFSFYYGRKTRGCNNAGPLECLCSSYSVPLCSTTDFTPFLTNTDVYIFAEVQD